MIEKLPNNIPYWLKDSAGRHFVIKEADGSAFLHENPGELLSDHQKTMLAGLMRAGLLVGEERLKEGKVMVEVPEGTIPVRILSDNFKFVFGEQIKEVSEQVKNITGLPDESVAQHLVHLNFVDEGELSIRVFPSLVDEFDTITGMGSTAIKAD